MQKIDISVDTLKVNRPVVSGLLLNAYYSCLCSKLAAGEQMTDELKRAAVAEIIDLYGVIDKSLTDLFNKG